MSRDLHVVILFATQLQKERSFLCYVKIPFDSLEWYFLWSSKENRKNSPLLFNSGNKFFQLFLF